jgi:Restriction endonuclease
MPSSSQNHNRYQNLEQCAAILTIIAMGIVIIVTFELLELSTLGAIANIIRVPLLAVSALILWRYVRPDSLPLPPPPPPFDPYSAPRMLKMLYAIEPGAFEKLIAHLLIFEGYPIVESGENRPDGGIDLIIDWTDTTPGAVQCKRYIREPISYSLMYKFIGDMSRGGFTTGKYFTIIGFSTPARYLARSNKIDLWNVERIIRVLRMHREKWPREVYDLLDASSRNCKKCDAPMTVLRTRYDMHQRKLYWRCKNYSCQAIAPFGSDTLKPSKPENRLIPIGN